MHRTPAIFIKDVQKYWLACKRQICLNRDKWDFWDGSRNRDTGISGIVGINTRFYPSSDKKGNENISFPKVT